MARRPSSVCLSVRLSVNFCANRFSHANGRIAAKLAHDGLQVSLHPGCAQGRQGQGQGQRSRDTRTFLDSWNELLRHCRTGFIPFDRSRRALHDGVNSSVTSGKQLKLLTFKEIGSISVMWNLVKAQKCYC